ncbi:MAG TPA: DUF3572 domain-containing protein [Rhizomicrobium sp.]|nr:DUF3572 domain-containing protein [Rhizomicrobium sp.]
MKSPQTREKAEILALEALTWLAGHQDGLQRFLDLSGIDAQALRLGAGSPEMGIAVLDFLLANEDLLLGFCESAAVEPPALHMAQHRLGGAA